MTRAPVLTQDEAQALCDMHHIHAFLESETDVDFLEETNPKLLQAYETLRAISDGDEA